MAEETSYTVEQVIDELDDESDDDFEGYLDTEFDEEINDENDDAEEGGNEQDMDVGANMEIGASVPEYNLTPGCSASVDGSSPLSFFSLLMTSTILQTIVDQTNLYAQQFIDSRDLGPHSRARRWAKRVFDISELFRFLAILIVMGIVRYPQIESHWSTLWPYSNSQISSVS